jgi:hypothetical protein
MLETCLKRTQFYVCGKNQENHNLSCPWIMPQTITLYEAPIFKLYVDAKGKSFGQRFIG